MFSPKDKSAKESALKKLVGLMDQGDHEDLKGLSSKKPTVTAIDIEPEESDDDSVDGASMDEQEPSDEDKQKIKDLYEKYCR